MEYAAINATMYMASGKNEMSRIEEKHVIHQRSNRR